MKPIIDNRGCLLPIEFDELSFIPKRIFFIGDVPKNCVRGGHSHFKTKQLLICLSGEIDVILHDGINETVIKIKKHGSILIPELIWDSQKFLTKDSKLLVICSTNYDKNDYIMDFQEFKRIKQNII